jgi:hypothetical protein
VEEDRWFIANIVLKESEITVAPDEDMSVSLLALDGEETKLLHTQPTQIGHGAGGLWLENARAFGLAALEFWCFQQKIRRSHSRSGTAIVQGHFGMQAITHKICQIYNSAGNCQRIVDDPFEHTNLTVVRL